MSVTSFFPKIEQWSDTYNVNENKHYYCSHMPYLFCFSSFSDERINNKPVMIEAEIVMKPNVRIFQVSVMPPNIDDNTTAVVIYLEISINHLPNSFFISFQYFAAKVQRKSETAKSLAEFLVFLFVWKLTQEHFFIHRLAQISTDFLISKDIVIITDFYQ